MFRHNIFICIYLYGRVDDLKDECEALNKRSENWSDRCRIKNTEIFHLQTQIKLYEYALEEHNKNSLNNITEKQMYEKELEQAGEKEIKQMFETIKSDLNNARIRNKNLESKLSQMMAKCDALQRLVEAEKHVAEIRMHIKNLG